MALIYECNKTCYEKESLRYGNEKSDKSTYLSISQETVDSCWAFLQVVPTVVLPNNLKRY